MPVGAEGVPHLTYIYCSYSGPCRGGRSAQPGTGRPATTVVLRILDLIGESLPIFVALAIGLMLRSASIRSVGYMIMAAAVIRLLVKPLVSPTIARDEFLPPWISKFS